MSPYRCDCEKAAGMANKTSPCTPSVLQLGKTPRVPGAHIVDMETEAEAVIPDRNEKHTLPTKVRIMSMLSMALIPEERRAFRKRFCQASKKDEGYDMEQPQEAFLQNGIQSSQLHSRRHVHQLPWHQLH